MNYEDDAGWFCLIPDDEGRSEIWCSVEKKEERYVWGIEFLNACNMITSFDAYTTSDSAKRGCERFLKKLKAVL